MNLALNLVSKLDKASERKSKIKTKTPYKYWHKKASQITDILNPEIHTKRLNTKIK